MAKGNNSKGFFALNKKSANGEMPWRIYAVAYVTSENIGEPPYYRVVGEEEGELLLRLIHNHSEEYRRVHKWVGTEYELRPEDKRPERRLFNSESPGGVLTEAEVIARLRQYT